MSLHTLSMDQALSLWSELEQAYFGKNGYGGDTAELYLYRFMGACPVATMHPEKMADSGPVGDTVREDYDTANAAMHDLLKLFAERRDAQIEVEGSELGAWLRTARYTHRVHVRVIPLGRRR